MKNGPRAVSHAQTESQRPHIKKIYQNEKLWTRIKILPFNAIVVDHDV
jgi:hypothetical protein